MAYRLVLEVPASLAEDANSMVSAVPDAQVLLIRNSHGLGFDDAWVDLSIACHSLRVIEAFYLWLAEQPQPWPDLRLVLHDGRRVRLAKADASLVVAAVRRDQPWVDHTMPMIGAHEPLPFEEGRSAAQGVAQGNAGEGAGSGDLMLGRHESLVDRIDTSTVIPVHDPEPAERVYREVLDLHVVGRARRDDHGNMEVIPDGYDAVRAQLDGVEADVVFLENGPLKVTLQRTPRGLPLPYGTNPAQVRITASPEQVAAIRGRALMSGFNVLESVPDQFSFLDPFNVIWTVTPITSAGNVPALQG